MLTVPCTADFLAVADTSRFTISRQQPVAARIDFRITVITFNLLTMEQPSYCTYMNCCSCVDRRNHLGQAVTTCWTLHDHAMHLYGRVLHTLALMSGIHFRHTITDDLNMFAAVFKSRLKHSFTAGPISNHSATLIAPAICLIGQHTACF